MEGADEIGGVEGDVGSAERLQLLGRAQQPDQPKRIAVGAEAETGAEPRPAGFEGFMRETAMPPMLTTTGAEEDMTPA